MHKKFSIKKTPEEDGFPEFSQHFKFIKNIGIGAYGKVVYAEYLKDNKKYAVKVSIK